MFIISLTYIKDISEVEKYFDSHMKFIDQYYASGNFMASGKKVPRTGGVILADFPTYSDVEEVVRLDPFILHGVAKYEIIEFVPTRASDNLSSLLESA